MESPEWIYKKLFAIETCIRCGMKANHAKVFYWSHYGKSHYWIAENVFTDPKNPHELGTIKNLMSFALKQIRYSDELPPHSSSQFYLKQAAFLVLDEMIGHKVESIDYKWPPPERVDWQGLYISTPVFFTRFEMCFDVSGREWK